MRLAVLLISCLLLVSSILGQERRTKRKPVLIRADRTKEEVEEVPPIPDPGKAKEHVEIGNFYFKRENYKAAEDRYREAIQYNPKSVEAYEKLIRVLEKRKAYTKAVEVCRLFVESNPTSDQVEHFQSRIKKFERESQKSRKKPG